MINKIRIVVATFLLMAISANTAISQEGTTWFGDSADGQWLVGVKLGSINNDAPGFEDASLTTLVLGYQFSRQVGTDGTASLELEIGKSDDADLNNGLPGSEWEAETLGLFINYRTAGDVYFKVKLGLMSTDIEARTGRLATLDVSDTNFAYGAGFGVILGQRQNINLELDWTGSSGDNDVNLINLGGLVRF